MSTKRNTKEEIFMAAARLFAEKGFRGVSMQDIANAVDLHVGAIYNHYTSKDTIMEALLDHYHERIGRFYVDLAAVDINIEELDELPSLLRKLLFSFETTEVKLMFYLSRIVYHEQFLSRRAAEELVGDGFQKFSDAYRKFFDRLADNGILADKRDNQMYGELYARMHLTFGIQFLHPEIDSKTDPILLGDFLHNLLLNNEKIKKGIFIKNSISS